MIKAIDTEYKGFLFRSRLEAKWAYFFDSIGIPYDYEPEGFDIDGKWYLPDFYLPWFNVYVEIKPKHNERIEEAKEICIGMMHNDKPIVLCIGDPADNEMYLYCGEIYGNDDCVDYHEMKCGFYEGAEWGELYNGEYVPIHGFTKHTIAIVAETDGHHKKFIGTNYVEPSEYECGTVFCEYRSDFNSKKLEARKHRFDHMIIRKV